jgi:2-dehydropantoate 2-reductase
MTPDNNHGIKKICVYGIDGIGGYFGGKMAETAHQSGKEGYEVYFVTGALDREGAHLRRIQENGLILKSPGQDPIFCKPTSAVADIRELPPMDMVLISGRNSDLEWIIGDIAPSIRPETVIIPLFDGIDIYYRIRNLLPEGMILPGCVEGSGVADEPGIVVHTGGEMLNFGRDPKYAEDAPEAVFKVLDDFKIKYRWIDDPAPAIWERFIQTAAFNLITAYSGKTAKDVLSDAQLKTFTRRMVSEMVSVAQKEGIQLAEQNVFESLEKGALHTQVAPSGISQGTVMTKDDYSSTFLRLGKKYRIPTPITDLIGQYLQNMMNPPCPDYF